MRISALWLLALWLPSLALGSITTCSDDEGDGLLLNEWDYGGGPPPPPQLVTSRGRVHYRGLLLDHWTHQADGTGIASQIELAYEPKDMLVSQGPPDNRVEVYRVLVRVTRKDGKPLLPDGTKEVGQRLTCVMHRQLFP